jgi:hypothetical protein
MKIRCYIILLLSFLTFNQVLNAQSLPAGANVFDESFRNLQLMGKIDIDYSMNIRPFYFSKQFSSDSFLHLIDTTFHFSSKIYTNHKNTRIELLPFSSSIEYNSHHPYGWNHSGMLDAKGFQTITSAGIFANWGMLSIQFLPNMQFATNPNFETSNNFGANTKGAYQKMSIGQSSIRLNLKGISLGLSNENMWWGPGIQNSLLMSNNAPGFEHLTINTIKPIKTPIGKFEFQMIAGKLIEDTSVLLEIKDLTSFYYAQGNYGGYPSIASLDTGSWRYLNALTVSYNPKWIPGLFLGFTRLGYTYNVFLGEHKDFLQDYLPVFIGLFRSNSNVYKNDGSNTHTKQLISISAKYIMPEAHAEIYAEYGSNDNTLNMRDFIMSPNHGAIYTAGFKKLYQLNNKKWVDLEAEITQLSQSIDYIIRSTGYTYSYQGSYTNQSRILGAGYGNGSNMQTYTASLINGFNKNGIVIQRILHDPLREPYLSENKQWEDFSLGYIYQKRIKQFIFHAQAQLVQSSHYAWTENTKWNFYCYGGLVYLIKMK